ncbi:MAG: hypothetical protein IJV41_11160 [Oscillospiraceae bacterium]|nr:hypothetical protein [Oscillospiraceae bacterium]
MKSEKKAFLRSLLPGLLLSLGLCFMLFVYAPFELLLTNRDDFWFSAGQMLPYTLVLFAAGLLVCSMALLLARRLGARVLTLATAALMLLVLGFYVQGNFLVAGLPGLNGALIDWNAYPKQRLLSVLCWLGCALVTGLLLWRLREVRFRLAAGALGGGMTLLLALTLVGLVLTGGSGRHEVLASTDQELLSMSEQENFIVVHLDAVDACAFEEIIAADPTYQTAFADFTYYDNTTSGYPNTKCSVPLILTGRWYEAQQDYDSFVNEAMAASPLLGRLEEKGYRLGLYDMDNFYLSMDLFDGRFENMRPDDPVIGSKKEMAVMVVRMALVKYAPWDLKRPGYNLQRRLQTFREFRQGGDLGYYDWSNEGFYSRLNQSEPIRLRPEKTFKYIELEGAHNPFVYLRDVTRSENATYKSGIEASLTIALRLIEQMKACGAYDNAVLVFMADHGYNPALDDTNYNQHPLLLIKGRGESHPFAVNNAPVSHEDIVDAFRKLLDGAPGGDCFDWQAGQTRERRFLRHDWRDITRFEEYIQTGQAEDMETLRPSGRIYTR